MKVFYFMNLYSNSRIEQRIRTLILCCCCSVAKLCPTLCDPMDCSTPVFPVLHSLLEFAQTHAHWVSDAIQPSHPLSPPPPPPALSLSNEYSGLISFKIDWLNLFVVQGTLKSLLWPHSSKASILQHSALYSSTVTSIHDHWKNHSLDWTDLCWQSDVSAF